MNQDFSSDFLSLFDWKAPKLLKILERALALKKMRRQGKFPASLKNKNVVLIFEKPSTRTKVSFELAVKELGGNVVTLESQTSQLGRGETYSDTGKVLSRYAHAIVMRTFAQKNLEEIAEAATIPVINALSDFEHPCQVMADLMTLIEKAEKNKKTDKKLKKTVAYIGDGNNMTHSWMMAAKIFGFRLKIATPKGYEPDAKLLEETKEWVSLSDDPVQAVSGVDVINTDTWFSMGQTAGGQEVSDEKKKLFEPFQLNQSLLQKANPKALVLHCLPAHRGEEITDEVMDGPQSVVWDQAENRLHVQKAILENLVG